MKCRSLPENPERLCFSNKYSEEVASSGSQFCKNHSTMVSVYKIRFVLTFNSKKQRKNLNLAKPFELLNQELAACKKKGLKPFNPFVFKKKKKSCLMW